MTVASATNRARYDGLSSCRAAAQVAGGGKGCFWGCLGLADCEEACDFDAIRMDAHSLPVVDEALEVKGVLRYENLRHSLFDPDLGSLVRAEDLAVPAFQFLYPDDSVDRAWSLFQRSPIESMMVVTRETPHRFIGLVRRRELFRLFLRENDQ